MAIPHAFPGVPVNLRPEDESLSEVRTTALVKETNFEVIRMVIPQGKAIPSHKVDGPITVHCLEGSVAFTADGETRELTAGHWLYLRGGQDHALAAHADSLVLLTIMFVPEAKP